MPGSSPAMCYHFIFSRQDANSPSASAPALSDALVSDQFSSQEIKEGSLPMHTKSVRDDFLRERYL